jgi:hypothetical protein
MAKVLSDLVGQVRTSGAGPDQAQRCGAAPQRADGFTDRDRRDKGVANHLRKHAVAGSWLHLPGADTACALRVEEGLFDRVRGEGAGGGVGRRGFGGAAEAA